MAVSFLSPSKIEAAAEAFRRKWDPTGMIPVPIIEIVELKLELNIVPVMGLMRDHNVDSFLTRDLRDLVVDEEIYMHQENRTRFSFAHEVGHLVIHSEYLRSLNIGSIDAWKKEVLGKGTGHAPMETQANMFASFLLMPTPSLREEFEKQKKIVATHPLFKQAKDIDDRALAQYVAKPVAKRFGVSEEAANIRLQNWLGGRL